MSAVALTDEEKLLIAYGDRLAAIKSLRMRVGGIYHAMQIVDAWAESDEARVLGVPLPIARERA